MLTASTKSSLRTAWRLLSRLSDFMERPRAMDATHRVCIREPLRQATQILENFLPTFLTVDPVHRDLTQALQHMGLVDDRVRAIPDGMEAESAAKMLFECRKELSDARRLIDRVEQERSF